MTLPVITLIGRVRSLLQDTDSSAERWSNQDLLDCFNEAQLAVVQNRPDTYSQVMSFTCTDKARQTVPPEAYRLMDVIDNESTGRAVTKTTRASLDSFISNWSTTQGTQVEQFIYDEKSPGVFYVYPVPPANHTINLLISRTPALVSIAQFASPATTMELDTVWLNPVINYMMYRAYMMDGETEQNQQQAHGYLKMFANDLQLKWNVDLAFRQPQQGGTANG